MREADLLTRDTIAVLSEEMGEEEGEGLETVCFCESVALYY